MEPGNELCGYLSVLNPKVTLIRTGKRKWFKFSENTCKLYYYVAPNPHGPPQGEININQATFTFDTENKTSVFTISTGDKSIELEAYDQQTAMFWVQELQRRRNDFSRRKTERSAMQKSDGQIRQSGLVDSVPEIAVTQSPDDVDAYSFPILTNPKDFTVVDAPDKRRNGASRSKSFSNWKDHVVNTISRTRIAPENNAKIENSKSCRIQIKNRKDIELCSKCFKKISGEIVNLQDELNTNLEINNVLRSQIDELSQQRYSWLQSNCENNRSIIDKKDLEISHLRQLLTTTEQQLEEVTQKMEDQSRSIQVKDQQLITLSNHISHINQELADNALLQDKLNAYEKQNQILNSEILQLNQLRKESEQREHKLILESGQWEANFYQIQSKYLVLLNDLHIPRQSQENQGERISPQVIDRLLQDVISNENETPSEMNNSRFGSHDHLGFTKREPVVVDDSTIESCATNYEKKCRDLLQGIEEKEGLETRESKWDVLMMGDKEVTGLRGVEMKEMIRNGIPHQYRSRVWNSCINQWVKPIKDKLPPNYYNNLLASHTNVSWSDPSTKQIELDLLRTLPNNRHYQTMHSEGTPRLRRVLLAYSWHNTEVGYCQGLNRIAAISLLYLNEEPTFWCLVAIVERIMPIGYYNPSLIGSQVDQRVLKDIVAEKLPRLHSHFDSCRLDLSLFSFNWFLCVFVDAFAPSIYLRIWDAFLHEGSKVLFRFAIAFFKLHEEDLLQCHDVMTVSRRIRLAAENLCDVNKFAQIAFHDINPFPMRIIKARRQHHTLAVQAQLDEVNKLRKQYSLQRLQEEEQLVAID